MPWVPEASGTPAPGPGLEARCEKQTLGAFCHTQPRTPLRPSTLPGVPPSIPAMASTRVLPPHLPRVGCSVWPRFWTPLQIVPSDLSSPAFSVALRPGPPTQGPDSRAGLRPGQPAAFGAAVSQRQGTRAREGTALRSGLH